MIAALPVPERNPDPAALMAAAAEFGVVIGERQARRLLDFRDLLARWNRAFNLVSRRDVDRLVPRHLLDSLTVAPWLTGTRVLDLGTGPGLPGVPLAIAREDAQFTLIDLSERKIRFTGQAVRALELSNVSPRCGDVRALEPAVTFDTVVCRAVADPATVWEMVSPRVRPGGRLVIMSRAQTPAPQRKSFGALPQDVRVEARRRIQIPGLEQPHEILVLGHSESTTGGSRS